MYSRVETQRLKHDFWIAFAEKYPRKWLLYDTKIKDFAFKFFADNRKAQVMLEIEHKNEALRKIYFEKIESLKTILEDEFITNLVFERSFFLENGKEVSRVWVELNGYSISKRGDWDVIFDFFNEKMTAFEFFFYEYQDYIKDLETNT